MCKIEGGLDAQLYTEILEECLLGTLSDYSFNRSNLVFQQDNHPKHTSKLAQKWFKDNKIELLSWPKQSPDFNPFEHLWVQLKRRLAAYETESTSMQELWERMETEWEKIRIEECKKLINSMGERVNSVYKAKGGHTNY